MILIKSTKTQMIYHIVKTEYWKLFEDQETYFPESYAAEGFIHLSTQTQVAGVLERYYKNTPNLLLLSINESLLTSKLIFEASTNDELFPHLYGELNKNAVVEIKEI